MKIRVLSKNASHIESSTRVSKYFEKHPNSSLKFINNKKYHGQENVR